jgi:hypothetical protein
MHKFALLFPPQSFPKEVWLLQLMNALVGEGYDHLIVGFLPSQGANPLCKEKDKKYQ